MSLFIKSIFYISASELNLKSASHIRLSYMPHDSLKDYLKYHQNWFLNRYDKKSNKTYGILDTYQDGNWTIQREGNYTYYTGGQFHLCVNMNPWEKNRIKYVVILLWFYGIVAMSYEFKLLQWFI